MKVFAFDLGNVLFDFDYTIALKKIEDRLGVSVEKIIEEFYHHDFTLPFEKGLISGHDFYLDFKKTFLADFDYQEFIDIWCKIFSPIPEVVDLVKRLKSKYPIYLISNINQLHFDHLHKEHPQIFSLFDGLILSFKVKSIKPEIKIYEALKEAAGVEFKDIVYIDDRADLIEAAKRLDLQSLQFITHAKLISDLKSLKVTIP
jgi:putative hydrolase of the HAD superfamily